ncbi:hypothetical protein SSCG_02288 [Streptomyces clavuligerus]|nr:hypothetical protein SSCG_02288 [Streptomyces clavuligerus]
MFDERDGPLVQGEFAPDFVDVVFESVAGSPVVEAGVIVSRAAVRTTRGRGPGCLR